MGKKFMRTLSMLMLLLYMTANTGCTLSKRTVKVAQRGLDPYAEKQLPPETLTFCFPGMEPDGVKDVISAVEKELQPTLNVKLNFMWFTQDNYLNEIESAVKEGKSLDAFVLTKDDYHDEIVNMGNNGDIIDLKKLWQEAAPRLLQLYSKEELENVMYGGKLMAVPQHYPKSNRMVVVAWNEALKDVNRTNIKDYKELEQFIREWKAKYGNYGFGGTVFDLTTVDAFGENSGYVHLGNYLVYKWDDPEMKIIPWEQTPEFKEAVSMLQSWSHEGFIENYFDDKHLFGPQRFAMHYLGNTASMLTTYDKAQYFLHTFHEEGKSYTIFPLYAEKSTKKPVDTTAIVIGKNCKDPERVLKLLQWIQSKQENYDLFMYGIKDKNYKVVDNRVDFPLTITKYYNWDGSQAFLNFDYLREERFDPQNYKEEYKKYVETDIKYPPSFGFIPDTNKFQTFWDERAVNFQTLKQKIETENFDVNSVLNEFIDQQHKAGVDQLVTEVQKQLNQWKAEKK